MAEKAANDSTAVRALFDRARAVLGYDLLEICARGPQERLDRTEVAQPALYVCGLAAVEMLRSESPAAMDGCAQAAGLSLGEYTALAFAGAFDFEAGLELVRARGAAMQAAADATPSGMVSVLGLEADRLADLCQQASAKGRIRIANFLCPGNLVVSGENAACAELERLAAESGAMKTIRLAVAGAFHTEIMRPADEQLAAVLEQTTIRSPRLPVLSNVDARPHSDPDQIRRMLVRQVLEPVRWEESIRRLLADGTDQFYELGPGRVLAGLLKRIHRKAAITNVVV